MRENIQSFTVQKIKFAIKYLITFTKKTLKKNFISLFSAL